MIIMHTKDNPKPRNRAKKRGPWLKEREKSAKLDEALKLLQIAIGRWEPGEVFWTGDLGRVAGKPDHDVLMALNGIRNKEFLGVILWKIRPVKGRHSWYFSRIGQ